MNALQALMSGSPIDPASQNAPYVRQGEHNYNTPLKALDELMFRSWVQKNNVPFNPEEKTSDYDMRGFYRALTQQNPRAVSSVNANDGQMHYPDYWKTPLHKTFSQDSQWAGPVAPRWTEDDKLVSPGGRILFDERKR